ncbi:VOC family protein [bacterium]|nr:VOC family protein [bacterium]
MSKIATGAVHHIMLTVSDIDRTRHFYHEILGMDVVVNNPEGGQVAFTNGSVLLAARLPFDAEQTPVNDHFNENRYGLDHLSLSVSNRAALEAAQAVFDTYTVPHGEIKDLSEHGLPILVLAFRDPDHIQLELTAPAGE